MKKALFLLASLVALGAHQQQPCPVYGEKADQKDRTFDSLKNRNSPSTVTDNSVTLQTILTPGNDQNRFSPNQYVTVTGYVILVKAGGPENCECHYPDAENLDIHIELAQHPNDKNTQAMVVEINRFTKAQHPEFTVANLKQLTGKKVSVSGWMFFDYDHKQNAVTTNPTGTRLWRYTCWEVHPVLKLTAL